MKLGSRKLALLAAGAVLATSITVAQPAFADTSTIHVAPGGSGSVCSVAAPCSIEGAQAYVRAFEAAPTGDITVEVADGTYTVDETLIFREADGGRDGSTVRWTAADGAKPVFTGATPVSGWTVHDAAKNIYVANTPVGLDTRQLYVNKVAAQKAAFRVTNNAYITFTSSGMTINNAALDFLNTLPDQDRLEFESRGDFTNRYSPVASITNNVVTMEQPSWNNNTWGWDTPQNSFLAASSYFFNNSLAFVDEVGEWYIDPDEGKLYYKPGVGVDPNTLDVELPRLEVLASIGGTYDAPLKNLEFSGITFTGTSWLGPTTDGYATQQNGSFIKDNYPYRPADAFTSCSRGCEQFERARTTWYQQPAAVQVSAASNVTFSSNTFVNLGSSALGIGNDANAALSGVGLGASNIHVDGNLFTEVGGHGVFVGGNRPDAHHPSDVRMTNKDIYITNNTVNRAAFEYKDNSGILTTYVTNSQIVNNEVSNVSYDAIDTGYGWGMNDEGGSGEYTNRGYYNWNTRYTTPTTLKDGRVGANRVHHSKAKFSDGGSIYNLSATPGSVTDRNYVYNAGGVGLYADEGTRYATYRENVMQGTNPWYFNNSYGATNTSNNTITGNWTNSGGTSIPNQSSNSMTVTGNITVTGTAWPAGALQVICEAGAAPEYRTHFNSNLVTEDPACGDSGPIAAPYLTTAGGATSSFFGQVGDSYGIRAAGADVWTNDDDFGAIYEPDSVTSGTSVSARVDSLNDTNANAKSGVMIRNDMTQQDVSPGYAILAVTRSSGVVFQWDSNGNGRIDGSATASADLFRAIWVKLVRDGDQARAYYSYDGANYIQVGTAITLTGATAVQDGGIFSSSHNTTQSAINIFSELKIEQPKPEVAVTVNPAAADGLGGWWTGPVTLTATGTAGAGAADVEYKVGDGAYAPLTQPLVISDEGTSVVTFRAVDDDGNTSDEVVKTITIDSVAPAVTSTLSGRTVTIEATDATSGVTLVEYRLPGDPDPQWTEYTGPLTVGPAAETVEFRATDAAGNVSDVDSRNVPGAEISVDRVAGDSRYTTAVGVSQQSYPDGADVVLVANGQTYPDALSAGPAAAFAGGPLLLVPTDSVPQAVTDEINRLNPSRIVVIGGTPSVSAAAYNHLDSLPGTIERIAGADRYETSRMVAASFFGDDGATTAYVSTGLNFPDALTGGAAAGAHDAPVILVDGASADLTSQTADLLETLGVETIKVLGSNASVSDGIVTDLQAIAATERLAGPNRYETARAINADAFTTADRVFLSTGTNFPDALAGSAWAGSVGAPLFVVQPTCVPQGVLDDIEDLGATQVTLLGGEPSLSAEVRLLTPCA